jgi:hypothetical protein
MSNADFSQIRHFAAHWTIIVTGEQGVSNVVLGGGYSTDADVPAILSVSRFGHNRNADLFRVDALVEHGHATGPRHGKTA